MKKILIFLFVFIFSFSLFGNEKDTVSQTGKTSLNSEGERIDSDFGKLFSEKTVSLKRTEKNQKSLLKMGRYLTVSAISGFVGGSLLVGAGFITGMIGLHFSSLFPATVSSWSGLWTMVLQNFGAMSTSGAALIGVTMFLWVFGALSMSMILLLIPGIIIWARGARLENKKQSRIVPLDTDFGIAIRL